MTENAPLLSQNSYTRPMQHHKMGRAKRIWYLSPMRAAKVQASLRIRAVSPEPPLLSHTSSESRGTFRQKVRSLASLNGWACAVKIVVRECSKSQSRLTRHRWWWHAHHWVILSQKNVLNFWRMFYFAWIVFGKLWIETLRVFWFTVVLILSC